MRRWWTEGVREGGSWRDQGGVGMKRLRGRGVKAVMCDRWGICVKRNKILCSFHTVIMVTVICKFEGSLQNHRFHLSTDWSVELFTCCDHVNTILNMTLWLIIIGCEMIGMLFTTYDVMNTAKWLWNAVCYSDTVETW